MIYEKAFFPIGGGEELEERLYGALLITKYFNTTLEVLQSGHNTTLTTYDELYVPKPVMAETDKVINKQKEEEFNQVRALFNKAAEEVGINVTKDRSKNEANAYMNTKEGLRSELVEQESKFCDIVFAAAPPSGRTTATFETAVLKSGKPVIMFPRVMKEFKIDSIIIGWNNSPEASRALTSSVNILKLAQRVHIVSSEEYVGDTGAIEKLKEYLSYHDINATFDIIETTNISGQALLNAALDGNFDLIVAGAYGHRGLKELMFGGLTRYLLENSPLPVFVSH